MFLDICTNSNVLSVFYLIKTLINIMSIIVPILLILLLSIDIFNVIKEDEKGMKSNFNKMITRLIWAFIIFLIPLIVNLLMSFLSYNNFDKENCWTNANADVIKLQKAKEEAFKKEDKLLRQKALEEYRLNKAFAIDVRSGIEAKNEQETRKLLEELIRSEEKNLGQNGLINDDGVVRFFQCDYKENAYSRFGTICSHGCGPTSAAVIISTLNAPKRVDPIEATQGVCSRGGCYSSGSSWDGVNRLIESEGIKATAGSLSNFNRDYLRKVFNDGGMLIVLVGPGIFTRGGHFFVIYGMDNDDKLKVVQVSNKEQSKKTWSISDVKASLSSYYIYKKGV